MEARAAVFAPLVAAAGVSLVILLAVIRSRQVRCCSQVGAAHW